MTKDNSAIATLRKFIPPVIPELVRALSQPTQAGSLFRGHDQMFKARLKTSRCYGEYGCGASTIWVAKNCGTKIISVDTSRDWIEKVRTDVADASSPTLVHVDLGELGDWGRPVDYCRRSHIVDYLRAPFTGNDKPDTILIDGRFRVACFLQSILLADAGTVIFFDDYVSRRHFHIVEEYLPVHSTSGDQAQFVVSDSFNRAAVETELQHFMYVMD